MSSLTSGRCLSGLLVGTVLAFAQTTQPSAHPVTIPGQVVAGYLENVSFAGNSSVFQAKLDTGANSGALNAPNPRVFHRDGNYWVRFSLTNNVGRSHTFEAPIKDTVRIRRAGTKIVRRFLVDLEVCIGGYKAMTDISLADRTGQSYQLLIGRKFLADKVLVDSRARYRFSGQCTAQ